MARLQLSPAKQKKDRLAVVSPKCDQGHLSRSTRADRQAAAGSKGEVRLLFRRACRDLQRVIGDFKGKHVMSSSIFWNPVVALFVALILLFVTLSPPRGERGALGSVRRYFSNSGHSPLSPSPSLRTVRLQRPLMFLRPLIGRGWLFKLNARFLNNKL